MKKLINFCLGLLLCPLMINAQLSPGDVLFTGYNSDGKPNVSNTYDGLSLVALADIPANTTLYISENEWDNYNASFWNYHESVIEWSSDELVEAGSVIIIRFRSVVKIFANSEAPIANVGTAAWSVSTSLDFNVSADYNNGKEVLYVYTGTAYNEPTTFLTAYANDDFTYLNGELPNALDTETSAVEFDTDKDIRIYSGYATWNLPDDMSDLKSALTDVDNWTSDDGTGEQDLDGLSADFPTDVILEFTGTLISLPVNLITFNGRRGRNGTMIHWQTAAEKNNELFKLQRSTDGISFETIAEVEGRGTTSETTNYEYFDYFNAHEKVYYRLIQFDYDGQFEKSPVIVVQSTQTHSRLRFSQLPNTWNIYMEEVLEKPLVVSCFDNQGNILYNQELAAGIDSFEINHSNWAKGIYFVQFAGNSYKLVK